MLRGFFQKLDDMSAGTRNMHGDFVCYNSKTIGPCNCLTVEIKNIFQLLIKKIIFYLND